MAVGIIVVFSATIVFLLWDYATRSVGSLERKVDEAKLEVMRLKRDIELQSRRTDVLTQRAIGLEKDTTNLAGYTKELFEHNKGMEKAIGELNKKLSRLKDFRQMQNKGRKFK